MKNLLQFSEKLKHLPRTGWLIEGIEYPETVAAHSWQMALMALALSEQATDKYDYDKVIKLCLCHDLAESVIGDITPHEKEYKDKSVKEIAAIQSISQQSNFPMLLPLFIEYEDNQTKEARLAHDLDKLDLYAQALDYEKKYPNKDLSEFKESAISGIKTTLGKKILKNLEK